MTEGKTHECYFMYGSRNMTQMCLVANEPTFLEKKKKLWVLRVSF